MEALKRVENLFSIISLGWLILRFTTIEMSNLCIRKSRMFLKSRLSCAKRRFNWRDYRRWRLWSMSSTPNRGSGHHDFIWFRTSFCSSFTGVAITSRWCAKSSGKRTLTWRILIWSLKIRRYSWTQSPTISMRISSRRRNCQMIFWFRSKVIIY
jgi:hypothetical protein